MYQNVVEEIQNLVKEETNEVHTALPGTIISYDAQNGKATVQPKGSIKVSSNKVLEYPQLNDVPIVFPFSPSAQASIAFPIQEGDSCLIIFCEQALDTWLEKGDTSSELKYSLTNAIAIPGLMKSASAALTEAVATKSIVISCGENKVRIGKDKIVFSGKVTIDGDLDVNGTINHE